MEKRSDNLCPSADPAWRGAVAFGIIGGTVSEPEARYLPAALPVTGELLRLAEPATPVEVFRFGAPCLNGGCVHFEGGACSLVSRIVKLLPEATEQIPHCSIRPSCRWWRQEGAAACRRCPQVVTENYNPSGQMRAAAQPPASDLVDAR